MKKCFACERIDQIQKNANPHLIQELEVSYLVLADNQFYEGYCIHLLKEHAEQLPDLALDVQLQLFKEVAQTAQAIQKAFAPIRLNYACLCNECHHIHWHVIPRYGTDPAPLNSVWVPANEEKYQVATPERRAAIIEKVRNSLSV